MTTDPMKEERRREWLRHILLFAAGAAIGIPLAVQSWKSARALDDARRDLAALRAGNIETIGKVLRD